MSIAICESSPKCGTWSCGLTLGSRSQANTLAVDERQKVETLRREQKTLRDALVSVEDKLQQAERQKAKLTGEIDRLSDIDEEVCSSCLLAFASHAKRD